MYHLLCKQSVEAIVSHIENFDSADSDGSPQPAQMYSEAYESHYYNLL